jgi:hypothetical protein
MAFTVKVIGDLNYLAETMRAVSHIMSLSGFGSLIMIGFLLGIFWIVTQGILSGGKEIKIQNMIVAALMYAVFFGVNVDEVTLEADRSAYLLGVSQYEIVQDVPLGLALTSSLISTAGSVISDWYRTHFQTINPYGMDPLFTLELLMRMRDVGFSTALVNWDPDGVISENVDRYMLECTQVGMKIPRADGSLSITSQMISKAGSPGYPIHGWAAMKFFNNLYQTRVSYLDGTGATAKLMTEDMGCADAHDRINEKVLTADIAQNWIKEMVVTTCASNTGTGYCPSNIGGTGMAASTFLTNAVARFNTARDAFLNTSVATDVQLFNRVALGAFARAKEQGRVITEGDIMVNMIADRATGRITQTQALQGTVWERSMQPLMAFFEAIMFIAAPFAAFILVVGVGGMSLIGKYLMFAVWIQLWKPVMAAIEMFVEMSAMGSMASLKAYSSALTGDIGTIARDTEAFNEISHWIGTGSMLMASTPAITLMLIYGSAVTASSLAGRVDAAAGASVGTDDTKGSYSTGGALAQVNNAGHIAQGSMATQSDSTGNIDLSAMSSQALQASTRRESSFRASAAEQTAEATRHTQGGLASYVDGVGNSSVIGTTDQTVSQQANNIVKSLDQGNTMSAEERAITSAALTVGMSGSAGFNQAKKDANKTLKDNNVDTKGWSDAQFGQAIGIMAQAGASGQISYAELDSSVSNMSEKEQLALTENWSKSSGISEADQSSTQENYTKSDSVQAARDSSQSATKSRERAEAEANSRSKIENLAIGSSVGTRIGMADVDAALKDPNVQENVSDHIRAMQDQGVPAYQNVSPNVAGARSLLNKSAASDFETYSQLLGVIGSNDLTDQQAGLYTLTNGYTDDVDPVDSRPTSPEVAGFYTGAVDGVNNASNSNTGKLNQQAPSLRGNVSDRDYTLQGNGSEQMLNAMIEQNGINKDTDLGINYNDLSLGEKMNRVQDLTSEMNRPDNAARDLLGTVKHLASEEGQQALIEGAALAAGGAGVGLMSTMAMGALSGAGSGGLRGSRAGAYGMAAGATVGAAYGAYRGYEEYNDTQMAEGILNKTGGSLDAGSLSQLDNDEQNYLNESMKSVAFGQMEAMAEASQNGQAFDADAYRSSLGTEFEQRIFDNMGGLLAKDELSDARGEIGQAIDRGSKHQIIASAGYASDHVAGRSTVLAHANNDMNMVGEMYDSFVSGNGPIETAEQEAHFVSMLGPMDQRAYAHRAELGMAGMGDNVQNESFFEWRDNPDIEALRTDRAVENYGATPTEITRPDSVYDSATFAQGNTGGGSPSINEGEEIAAAAAKQNVNSPISGADSSDVSLSSRDMRGR